MSGLPDGIDDAHAHARHYATVFGWRVAPVPRGTKHPRLDDWPRLATTDVDIIDEWWRAWPSDGVSIVCGQASGVFVVDVDDHGAERGADTLADLEATYGPLPDTATVLTGGGGMHLYFVNPPGLLIPTDAGKLLGPGLDVRAEGGQVIAPPSIHASGQRYAWEVEHQPAPDGWLFSMPEGYVAVAWPPEWLLALLTQPPPERPPRKPAATASARLPGEQWALETDWGDLLAEDGATYLRTVNDRQGGSYDMWARPGLDALHVSASLGYRGSDVLKVFSSNWPGLDEGATYTKFGYYAAARHGGDYQAAAASLVAQGYVQRDVDLASLIATAAPTNDEGVALDPAKLGIMSVRELVEGDDPPYDWLIPGLIERGDRVIFTGDEGYGKSTLLRQMAASAAAGINPLALSPEHAVHRPVRVLLVDLENSRRQVRREWRKVFAAVGDLDQLGDRLSTVLRTEGLVLDDPADRAGDRAWLLAVLAVTFPDLLLIGPYYKMLGGDPDREQDARHLPLFLDKARMQFDMMAVTIEAHAGHKEKRPVGWSGLKRWPEFGFHLHADGGLVPFRGGRDADRPWPKALRRGGDGAWPWLPAIGASAPPSATQGDEGADVATLVVRALHRAARPLSRAEVMERVGRRREVVRVALAELRDTGWLIVGVEDREGIDGKVRRVEVFGLDPAGPAGG